MRMAENFAEHFDDDSEDDCAITFNKSSEFETKEKSPNEIAETLNLHNQEASTSGQHDESQVYSHVLEEDLVDISNVRESEAEHRRRTIDIIQNALPHTDVFSMKINEDVVELFYKKPPKIVNDYLFGQILGEGSYGKVKECLHVQTLVRYAVKILKDSRLKKIPNGHQNVQREIELLRRVKHEHVVVMHHVFRVEEKQKTYMIMDYCITSIQEMLDQSKQKKMPPYQAHEYFVQLIDGLEYLHCNGVVHKDIKPGNLLLGLDETLKITDLGVAEEIDRYLNADIVRHGHGTPKFQAPEIAAGNLDEYRGFPLDVWSSGITLFNLVTGTYPFDGAAILPLYQNIVNQPLVFPPSATNLSDLLKDLITQMLIKDYEKRITIDNVRRHAWFRRIPPRQPRERLTPPEGRFGGQLHQLTVYDSLAQMFASQSGSPEATPPQTHHANDAIPAQAKSMAMSEPDRLMSESRAEKRRPQSRSSHSEKRHKCKLM